MAAASSGLAALSARYATALYELAENNKALDDVSSDISALQILLQESDDLARVICSKTIPTEQILTGVLAVLEKGKAHKLTKNFVSLLSKNSRLYALESIVTAYIFLAAERQGFVTASVISAKDLSALQMSALETAISQAHGHKVSIDLTVDPSLIGGMIVKIGSRMIDSSLRGKLQRLQYVMKGVG